MIKFGICNEIFQDWSLEEGMRYAKKAGYDAVEIAPFTLAPSVTDVSDAQRREIRQMAQDIGIQISGIHWVLVKTEGLHLTSPDEAVREKTADYFRELVRFCDDIGGSYVINGSPKQRNLEEGVSLEQGREWAFNAFKPAVEDADSRGITICFEPLAPAETNFINTAREAVDFAKSFQSPAMSVILDVKAMSSESQSIPDIIRETGADFDYFHANDANLKGPGFGEVDFVPIVQALTEVGYDGFMSVEVFKFEEGPEAIALKSLRYLEDVFDRLG